MKYFYSLSIFIIIFSSSTLAQGLLKGVVKDASTKELLPYAIISAGEGKATQTNLEGEYELTLPAGTYQIKVTYVGYNDLTKEITIAEAETLSLNFELTNITTEVVEIVSDYAQVRKTPVAFSTLETRQIQEELGGRDLSMLMNNTPGVYATEQGGGLGDSRINIRGFDQRNIAVLVDGVPVNDMENGWVYWSNWAGLADITQSMQVQRGLGATKLAVASVGGTTNIITKGIESKMGGTVRQEVGNNGYLKTGISYNSGLLKGGWGFAIAGTYFQQDGWVDQTWAKGGSYFFKIQKNWKRHILFFSVNAAPQEHGQRVTRLPVYEYDTAFARSIGIAIPAPIRFVQGTDIIYIPRQRPAGRRYNPHWGHLNGKPQTERINYYHKPLFNLSHSWTVTDRLTLSNVVYLSLGWGGGTRLNTAINADPFTGQLNLQAAFDANRKPLPGINPDPVYSRTEFKSSRILQSSINNHVWAGFLSTGVYKLNRKVTITTGIDMRYFVGQHYRELYDLLGGDYFVETFNAQNLTGNAMQPRGRGNEQFAMKRKGDKLNYYWDGRVMWGGLFGQVEWSKDNWSIFATATAALTGYQRIDYFLPKDVVLKDTILRNALAWGDTLFVSEGPEGKKIFQFKRFGDTRTYTGKAYHINSPEARTAQSDWKLFPGATLKTGANYNIDNHHNVYMNVGYLSIAPRFSNVLGAQNRFFDTPNQTIYALEIGAGARYRYWAANLNGYYTIWRNKPPDFQPTIRIGDETYTYNVTMESIHRGVELDGKVNILGLLGVKKQELEIDGVVSIGDWYYNSAQNLYLTDEGGRVVDTVYFSAKGVHVGDAAQHQFVIGLRYAPIKRAFIKFRYTYFDKNFSNFDPFLLTGERANRESWQIPAYGILNFHAGYSFKIDKYFLSLSGNILNVLDTVFISDAQNGDTGLTGTPITVYMGVGRRWNITLKISF
ncbi:MAG: carboxypeptidase-like regulatory domain-containing protein [Bacteroidia bacterium]|nr:carboxypeptidase-like regulatory domain-containing protein [Bacteroidia bacterium]MDW8158965.1 carboxypeptidase-like regulatory domain-containing protein [Bacteroidia bacterium]